jgi:hypothetical protein
VGGGAVRQPLWDLRDDHRDPTFSAAGIYLQGSWTPGAIVITLLNTVTSPSSQTYHPVASDGTVADIESLIFKMKFSTAT